MKTYQHIDVRKRIKSIKGRMLLLDTQLANRDITLNKYYDNYYLLERELEDVHKLDRHYDSLFSSDELEG